MNESDQTCEATPTQIIRETFLDSNRAKSGGESWAASMIEELEEKHKRAWDIIETLDTENAELKRQLAEGPVCGPCEHKRARAFLERQIAEGELIPLEVYIWWTEEEGMNIPVIGGMSLQEFAKRKAAQ
jgi:hypothetical protein